MLLFKIENLNSFIWLHLYFDNFRINIVYFILIRVIKKLICLILADCLTWNRDWPIRELLIKQLLKKRSHFSTLQLPHHNNPNLDPKYSSSHHHQHKQTHLHHLSKLLLLLLHHRLLRRNLLESTLKSSQGQFVKQIKLSHMKSNKNSIENS